MFAAAGGAADSTSVLAVAPPPSAPDTLVGTVVDDFAIEEVIGGGSCGTVYRARQLGLDRSVALKVPTYAIASDPVMARRFAREARAAARVTHPGVVAIYAVGELADGRPYLAMQLIDGVPLDRILTEGPVPVVRALRLARDIASALAETHAAAVVHRDLKPSNIMWRRDRHGGDLITLVDFGIAVARPANAEATRLTANGLIGTPHYMSPEQAHGERVDARADLYALGCILFELVTGAPPFDGAAFDVVLAHLGRPAPTPSERRPGVPAIVDALVVRLLAKRPDQRPQSADEVVALIDEALAQLAAPPAPPETSESIERTSQVAPAARPRWRLAMLSATIGALATIGVVALAGDTGSAAAPTDEADPTGSLRGRRQIVSDDGEMATRATLRDPLVAGRRVRTVFEVWNALGAPLDAPHLVITIEAPNGEARGLIAPVSRHAPDRFAFWHTFPVPGRYIVRVFPPEAPSVFTIEVEVSGELDKKG